MAGALGKLKRYPLGHGPAKAESTLCLNAKAYADHGGASRYQSPTFPKVAVPPWTSWFFKSRQATERVLVFVTVKLTSHWSTSLESQRNSLVPGMDRRGGTAAGFLFRSFLIVEALRPKTEES